MESIFTPVHLIGAGLAVLALGYVFLYVRLRGPEDTFVVAHIRLVSFLYVRLFHRLQSSVGKRDPLPPRGPAIAVANHLSGVDPLFISMLTRRRIHFLMAREYYEVPGLRWLFKALRCIPVNRDGNDFGAMKKALSLLRSGKVVGIFPQGGIRETDTDLEEGKSGVALLALKTVAPVIPFYISGCPRNDSVLRSFFTVSRTVVHCGAPLELGRNLSGRPSRSELEKLTRQVLESIAAQNPHKPETRRGGELNTSQYSAS